MVTQSQSPRTMQVIGNAPEGRILADYTHGPVVGAPGVGDSAAVTFQDLWRPAATGTGPELQLQNVTAWCGTSWEVAESTAAAALARSSSEPELTHSAASLQPISSEQESVDGPSGTEDGGGSTNRRRWVRPLAVAGGACALSFSPLGRVNTRCNVAAKPRLHATCRQLADWEE